MVRITPEDIRKKGKVPKNGSLFFTIFQTFMTGPEKLTPLLRLKYRNSIADAVVDLGKPEDIGRLFVAFQRFLYVEQVA